MNNYGNHNNICEKCALCQWNIDTCRYLLQCSWLLSISTAFFCFAILSMCLEYSHCQSSGTMSLVLCCVVVLKHDWIVPQNRAAYYAVHSRAMWMVYLVMRWRQCKTTPGTSNYLCQPETIPPFKGFCLNIDGYTLSFLKHTVYPSAWYKWLLAEKCTQGE